MWVTGKRKGSWGGEMGVALSCFDYTGNMVKPWAEAGYECWCIDIRHPAGKTVEGNITKIGADMLEWWPTKQKGWPQHDPPDKSKVSIAFFAPPCTDVAVSGARWFKTKGLRALINALELFHKSIELSEWLSCPYMIENPVGTVSTYWRKPDHIFQPWQYGDFYSKKTCLWIGNGFVMPKPIYRTGADCPVEIDERIWRMAPSRDRGSRRSETPMGFAKAVFEANR